MDKFTQLTGVAASLPMRNIDTDKIIPKTFLTTIERGGLGRHLFAELRYHADGSQRPDFVLNQPACRQAQIIIALDNFGCGSSREHAAWALLDFGIRCVIAPSFADIFHGNCFKNGILPLPLPATTCVQLMEDAARGANATLTIDLERQTVTRPDGEVVRFEIDPLRKHCLLNGLDEIGLTIAEVEKIEGYETRRRQDQPWLAGGYLPADLAAVTEKQAHRR